MPQKLMDVLMLGRCSHEFSWLRRAADGHYYQVCLVCAAEYKYDWSTTRRTERMQTVPEPTNTSRRGRSHAKKPTWVPRQGGSSCMRQCATGSRTWEAGTKA